MASSCPQTVHGVDISANAVAAATARYGTDKLTFEAVDVYTLQPPAKPLAFIYDNTVPHHARHQPSFCGHRPSSGLNVLDPSFVAPNGHTNVIRL